MTIRECCDLLKGELLDNGYEYGFYLDGARHTRDPSKGFDIDFDRALKNESRVQDPADTAREKIGTCIDAAVLMREMLALRGVSGKIWLLRDRQRGRFHTIFTFEAEGKTVYLELTPQSRKPWYGKEIVYASEEELAAEYRRNGYEIEDVTDEVVIGERPAFLLAKMNEENGDSQADRF